MTKDNCVHKVPLLQNLSPSEKDLIYPLIHHKTIQKGEIVQSPETEAQLTIVASGQLKVYKLNPNGKEQLIRMVHEGEYEGENYIFGLKNQSIYIEAVCESRICCLSQKSVNDILTNYPQVGYQLLQLNAQKTVALGEQNQLLAIDDIETRIAKYLISLSQEKHDGNHITISIPLKEVASYLATSPETISRKLKHLEETDLIQRRGRHIQLLNNFWQRFGVS